MALGREDGIEQLNQVQTLSDIEQGGGITESGHVRFERLRWLVGVLDGSNQIVDFSEVDLPDDLGFAIDALAIAGVVIGVAADLFGCKARHN